jgi:DNA-3-methyladenine glycosylase II
VLDRPAKPRPDGLCEGGLPAAVPSSSPLTTTQIARHLGKADPILARLIAHGGPAPLPSRGAGFPVLAQAILFQQISGKAGAAILRRLRAAHGGPGFPSPLWFSTTPTEVLRTAGVSPQKMGYLRDLASHILDGKLDLRRLPRQPDANVVEQLTAVRGIGTWTAQMYLIFSLHRPDVLPSSDLGIRKAVGRAWRYRALPAERTVERHARPWAPLRSHAAFYLWRSLDSPFP